MTTLDMTGRPCPIPVVEAKNALALPDTDTIEVLVDNIVAVQNLEKMANGLHFGYTYQQTGENLFSVTLAKNGESVVPTAASADASPVPGCAPSSAAGVTVLITGEGMGHGADELGRLLIKGFIFALTELSPLPRAVIFLNGGAHLTCEGAATVADLKVLEDKGVEILTCGTCSNFFGLTEKLAVGTIVDMMDITSRLAAAGRLITL